MWDKIIDIGLKISVTWLVALMIIFLLSVTTYVLLRELDVRQYQLKKELITLASPIKEGDVVEVGSQKYLVIEIIPKTSYNSITWPKKENVIEGFAMVAALDEDGVPVANSSHWPISVAENHYKVVGKMKVPCWKTTEEIYEGSQIELDVWEDL